MNTTTKPELLTSAPQVYQALMDTSSRKNVLCAVQSPYARPFIYQVFKTRIHDGVLEVETPNGWEVPLAVYALPVDFFPLPERRNTLQFAQQMIEIKLSDRTCASIPAMVALDTGLAYHHAKGDPNEGYVLTHLKTGCALVDTQVATKEEAQEWLESVVPLADWTRDWTELCQPLSSGVLQHIKSIAQTIFRKQASLPVTSEMR